jgi:hypothetical protein
LGYARWYKSSDLYGLPKKDMEKKIRCYFTHTALTATLWMPSSTRLSLLDRGFIYAIMHIRGEDLGRQWYDDGKLLKKKEYDLRHKDTMQPTGSELLNND